MTKMAVLNDQHCTTDASPSLTEEDRFYLDQFEEMRDYLRDRTRSVAEGYQNGCYFSGRAGTSKTFTILETLEQLGAQKCYRNSRMSPLGLYALLEEHPEHTIVLDDIPSLVQERQALQILMAALGGKPGKPRPVTYTTKNKNERKSFQFSGGIIAVSNLPLRRDPLADAVASRIVLLEHEPSDEILQAFMRHLALKGFEDMTPSECWMVVNFVIVESRDNDYRLDLRCMEKAWQDYRQHKHGKAIHRWEDLVRSSMKRILKASNAPPVGREDRKVWEQDIVLQLVERYPSDDDKEKLLVEWKRRTCRGYDAFRRRVRELKKEGKL